MHCCKTRRFLSGMLAIFAIACGVSWAQAALPEGDAASIAFRREGEVDTFRKDVVLFTDRGYTLAECPDLLEGLSFLRGSIDLTMFRIEKSGWLLALTPEPIPRAASQHELLLEIGFAPLDVGPESFQLFGQNEIDRVRAYWKHVLEGDEYRLPKWVVVLGFDNAQQIEPVPWRENTGELLYNGIRLPEGWPPDTAYAPGFDPLPVPYLEDPPEVLSIDIGRQLFVDDFLIQETNLTRQWHRARRHPASPVLTPETELERGRGDHVPMAAPFSGGVWYDPRDQLFKIWYHAGWFDGTAYAESSDGLHWERPALDVEPGTNRVIPGREGVMRDSAAVILDHWTSDPRQRFKMLLWGRPTGGEVYTSPDGKSWGEPTPTFRMGDRSTIFFNPFREKWVFSIRSSWRGRSRDYVEHDDLVEGASTGVPVQWMRVDSLDIPDPEVGDTPQLYNLDAVAYESLMLGALLVHLGPSNRVCNERGIPKLTDIHLGFSRDGFHWARSEDRSAFIAGTRNADDWDRAYLHSNAAVCVVMGDELWFYYTGFQGDETLRDLPTHAAGFYANASTGIATLRRDGFASMDAGDAAATLTTRPVTFSGSRLFINADVPEGTLRAEIRALDGTPIAPFDLDGSIPFTGDSTLDPMRWEGGDDLSGLAGQPVRIHFEVTSGSLYAFWISPDETGRSNGYVAGGGPGYTGTVDTVGRAALTPKRLPELRR